LIKKVVLELGVAGGSIRIPEKGDSTFVIPGAKLKSWVPNSLNYIGTSKSVL